MATKASNLEQMLARIVDTAHDGIIGMTLDGVITSWNLGATRLYGYTTAEMVGRSEADLAPPELRDEIAALIRRVCAGEPVDQYETRRLTKAGELLDIELTLSPITDDTGTVTGVSKIARDITERKSAERTLQESERRFSSLLDNVHLMGLLIDNNGSVSYCNDFFLQSTGWAREDVIGANWVDRFIPPDAHPDVQRTHTAMLVGLPEARHHENEVLTRSGERRLVRWDNTLLRSREGEAIGVASLGADITEHRRATRALKASEQRFRKLIENASDIIALADAAGTIQFVSASAHAVGGYAPAELVGTRFLDLIHPDELEASQASFAALLGGPADAPLRTERRYRHKDGSWLTMEVVSTNHLNTPGIDSIVVTLRDVTWRRQAEARLRVASLLIEQSPAVLFRWNATEGWPVAYVSDNVQRWGYSPEDLLSGAISFTRLIHPDDLQRIDGEVAAHSAAGTAKFAQEYRVITPYGETLWVEGHTTVERDGSGAPSFYQGVVIDISDRKRMELQLEASQHLTESILNTIPVRVFWKNRDLIYLGGNAGFAADAGLAGPHELVGKTDDDMAWRDQAELYRADDRQVIDSGQPKLLIEEPQRTADGKTVTLLTSKVPLRDASGQISGVLGTYMDISEHKLSQQNLQLFRELIDQSIDGIEVLDPDTLQFLDVNDTTCRELGYERDELLSMTVFDIDPQMSPARFRALNARIADSGRETFDSVHKRKDGSTFPVEISAKLVALERPYFVVSTRNLTERLDYERSLEHINRALKTLSAANTAVVHAQSEAELLQHMCEAIVEIGGYRLAWVGFAEHDESRSVRPAAWAGNGADYVANADISWADTERGRGPTGRCIRSGEPQVARDIINDPAFAPWRDAALEHGYQSSLALPVGTPTGVTAALMIYADEPDAFESDEMALLTEMAGDLGYGITALRTRAAHDQGVLRLARSLDATVEALAHTVELRDPYTAGHQRRVAEIAVALAHQLDLPEERIKGLRLAASIHDIGKISVPSEILAKPMRLSAVEYSLVQTHAQSGYELLQGIDFPWPVAEMIRQHHERIDGSGYPQGLKGTEILLEARIIAVADVIESMASHRPYRASLGLEKALDEIVRGRGTLFDEEVADACIALFRDQALPLPGY